MDPLRQNRILFPGNPWPEGHPVKEFIWGARVEEGQVWFDLHLKSQDYDAERTIEEEEDTDHPSSWEAPAVWGNYHACTLSSTYWQNGGFRVGPVVDVTLDWLDGRELVVDSPPPEDLEDNAFHVYLLGHDAVAEHRIRFTRIPGTDRFDIAWSGKLALAYVGDYDYVHAFTASLWSVDAPCVEGVWGKAPSGRARRR